MNAQEWTAKVHALRKQVQELWLPNESVCAPQSLDNAELLENLQASLEELRVAEEELRQQNEELATTSAALEVERWRYQELFDFAPDAYLVTTLDGAIREANIAAAALLNVSKQHLLSKPLSLYVAEAEREAFRTHLSQLSTLTTTKEWELRLQPREGGAFYALLSVSVARDLSGRAVGLRWLIRDITARKALEAQLRTLNAELEKRVEERTAALQRSNDELQQFAYVASHDLQEPLRTVNNYVQLLAARYRSKLDADAEEFIDYIVNGIARMQQLINDLLEYSRVERSGREFVAISCEAALARTLNNLRTAIADSGAVITHDPLPTVWANARQLDQVLQNLLSNALKFHGQAPPRVHISAKQKGAEWLFAVHDNGIGLDPKFAEHIFTLFQRLHTRQEYPGAGIGLAICKKIIEHHGGRIWVESKPGHGATFYFTLPIAEVKQ